MILLLQPSKLLGLLVGTNISLSIHKFFVNSTHLQIVLFSTSPLKAKFYKKIQEIRNMLKKIRIKGY